MTLAWFALGLLVGCTAAWLVLRAHLATARTAAELERRSSDDKLATAERARLEAEERFRAISAEALRENNSAFLQLAESKLQGYVAPLKESLEKVDGHVRTLEQARQHAFGALKQELSALRDGQERLRGETGNLVAALRTPHVRGRWGEMQLKRVVEVAGLLEHCDFVAQASVRDAEGGLLRPDLIVKLPGGKSVVVDAKAPLAAYLDAFEAQDDNARAIALASHARQVRDHMTKLAAKAYWRQFAPTPEFVVMFLPDEAFLRCAQEQDNALTEDAWQAGVILASPTTFFTVLRTVATTWRQEAVAESAREVHELGQELYDRLGTLAGHVHGLGQSIRRVVDHFNKTVGALETRVLVTGRRFRDHGVAGEELPMIDPVELQPRALNAPELTDETDGSQQRTLDAA
ncbi:MAG TPA: DNA recombination protein RmuC [Gaiellaceae bacterium]|nr:DNA recombination protein RmuC [Gaiellaceae bacterium]